MLTSLAMRNDDHEIERKFLVTKPPPGLDGYAHERVEQGYLTPPEAETSIRLRRYGERRLLTAKQGTGLRRREVEVGITEEQLAALWPLTEGRRLAKTRYQIPHGEHTIELDVYDGAHAGLLVAEVEFDDEAAAEAFAPPAWLGPDVTGDARYANAHLASRVEG